MPLPGAEPIEARVASLIMAARASGELLDAPALGHDLTDEQAYLVQRRVTSGRIARGEQVVGWKLGYTSEAMRAQMGIAQPNVGPLTDAMILGDGATVPPGVHQPKVEPEIALILGRDVDDRVDSDGIRAFVAQARAALEVVDSVWRDYRFTWADNTADGSSAAFVVLGPPLPPTGLAALPVVLRHNGRPVGSGVGADAMGDPFAALAWLSDQLRGWGSRLRSGDIVITGGLTPAVALAEGDVVSASIGDETVSVRRGGTRSTGRG